MGLLDSLLGGTLSQAEAAAVPALISQVLAKTNLGYLQGIVNQLQLALMWWTAPAPGIEVP